MPLTLAQFLQLLSVCAPLVAQHPTLRDLAIAQAKVESGFNPAAISPPNKDGLSDYGLMQIHPTNFNDLNLNSATARNACQNLAAYQTFLTKISRYNTGDPTKGFYNGYVAKIETTRLGIKVPQEEVPSDPLPECTGTEHISWLNCRAPNSNSHASYGEPTR